MVNLNLNFEGNWYHLNFMSVLNGGRVYPLSSWFYYERRLLGQNHSSGTLIVYLRLFSKKRKEKRHFNESCILNCSNRGTFQC
jgi:hypothetical protein